jgi:hypothetical protein
MPFYLCEEMGVLEKRIEDKYNGNIGVAKTNNWLKYAGTKHQEKIDSSGETFLTQKKTVV